jgi:hypothetical protein
MHPYDARERHAHEQRAKECEAPTVHLDPRSVWSSSTRTFRAPRVRQFDSESDYYRPRGEYVKQKVDESTAGLGGGLPSPMCPCPAQMRRAGCVNPADAPRPRACPAVRGTIARSGRSGPCRSKTTPPSSASGNSHSRRTSESRRKPPPSRRPGSLDDAGLRPADVDGMLAEHPDDGRERYRAEPGRVQSAVLRRGGHGGGGGCGTVGHGRGHRVRMARCVLIYRSRNRGSGGRPWRGRRERDRRSPRATRWALLAVRLRAAGGPGRHVRSPAHDRCYRRATRLDRGLDAQARREQPSP